MPKLVADAIILGVSLRNYVDNYSTQKAFCQGISEYFFKNSHLLLKNRRFLSRKHIDNRFLR